MKLPATTAAALSLALPFLTHAQNPRQFTDPANLRGERVQPKTGRELPIDGGQDNAALGLQQLLRKLSTRASLMLIVAHPDDEDGGMLTFYSRGLGTRVADLSLTRGEGGQNAVTGDFEDALGLIRTQELLSSDRYTGVDQFFGTEVDFGFSKTKEEAFRKWTHERVLYDAVRAVRLYRPLVIAAVFIGGVTDGHGQHQVSGQIAQEVFRAAADPTVFPELTREGILPWAPLKVYARVPTFAITGKGLFDYATNQYVSPSFTNYVSGQTSLTPPTADIVIHEGQLDPLLTNAAASPADLPNPHADPHQQLSYVQFARIGLGLQRTQIGPGVRLATAGAFDVSYHLYGSRLCGMLPPLISTEPHPNPVLSTEAKRSGETCVSPAAPKLSADAPDPNAATFFEGIDTSLLGLASLAPSAHGAIAVLIKTDLADSQQSIEHAQLAFKPERLESVIDNLSEALTLTDTAIRDVSGVSSDQLPNDEKQSLLHELRIKRVQLNDALVLALGLHVDATMDAVDVVENSSPTVQLTAPQLPDQPSAWPSVKFSNGRALTTNVQLNGQYDRHRPPPFEHATQLVPEMLEPVTKPYFYRDDVEQPVYQLRDRALRNAPATPPPAVAWDHYQFKQVAVDVGRVVHAADQPVRIVPSASLSLSGHAQVFPNTMRSVTISAFLMPDPSERSTPNLAVAGGWVVHSAPPNQKVVGEFPFLLDPPAEVATPVLARASATLGNGSTITEGFRPVGYPGLVYTNLYTPATDRIVPADLKLPTHRRVGYLAGTGDAVADNLRSVGFDVSNLTVSDLTPERLARFDTVILGVRTYNAHPDLHGAPTQALLDFARHGGDVIVQYQTPEFTAADAPFPLSLGSNEKVVDETAPVRLLTPSSLDASHLTPAQQPWQALLSPNHLTEADFNNWIEERGHGFVETWDPHYTALTETHDPGAPAEHIAPQLPQLGGLLTTALGRGHWTYCAFALYRQLPEAVPGAFRLFTNLLALADQRTP